jgi:P-type conjugative transfer protein TrbJ
LGDIAGQFTTWQQTIGNNLNTLGRSLGLQQSQQQNEASILQALQQHSQSAQGQMQAIQAGNELAGANAAELAQIQATLVSTAQMQATGLAVQTERRASEDAALRHFATPQLIPTTGYQSW